MNEYECDQELAQIQRELESSKLMRLMLEFSASGDSSALCEIKGRIKKLVSIGHDFNVQVSGVAGEALGAFNNLVTHRYRKGCTLMMMAVSLGQLEVCEDLFEAGANLLPPLRTDEQGCEGRVFEDSPVRCAIRASEVEVLKWLIKQGADVESIGEGGWSALQSAASRGEELSVQALIDGGANLKAKNKLGMTALALASYHNYPSVVSRLLQEAKRLDFNDMQDCVREAIIKDHDEVLRVFMVSGFWDQLGSDKVWELSIRASGKCDTLLKALQEKQTLEEATDEPAPVIKGMRL